MKKLTVGGIVIFVLTLIGVGLGNVVGEHAGNYFARSLLRAEPSIEEVCNAAAQLIDRSFAGQVFHGGLVLADKVVCEGTTIVYRYVYPDIEIDADIIEEMSNHKRGVMPILLRTYCEQMESMVEQGIAARWEYRDRNSSVLYHVLARTDICMKPILG